MKPRIELQSAYVLHTRAFKETSLLLDCFTQEHGKLSLLAKGARRLKSPQKGILRPFAPLLVSWVGKSELKTLTHAELHGPLFSFTGDRLASSFYLNELLMRLLHPYVAFPELFTYYQATLNILAVETNFTYALRLFEKHLLQALGYELMLHQDERGDAIQAGASYRYTPEQGLSLSGTGLLKGRALLDLAADNLSDPKSCAQAKIILQAALKRLLGKKPIQAKFLLIPEMAND